MKSFYQITLSYGCYGLVVRDETNTVIDAAPIARWMLNKPWQEVKLWIYRRGGTIMLLGELEEDGTVKAKNKSGD